MNNKEPMKDMSLTFNMPEGFVKAIGDYVIERLTPYLKTDDRSYDIILDVKALAAYIGVDENWIYQRTRFKEIPFIKKGKYCLFRKSVIDAWLNEDAIKPIPSHKKR